MAKGKMTKCKECGKPYAAAVKACPYCGGKNPLKKSPFKVILSIFAVFILIGVVGTILGGGDDGGSPKKTGDVKTDQKQSKDGGSSKEAEKTTFGVGEQVSLNDVFVTMNSVTESSGSQFNKPSDGNTFILCEFSIENNSQKDLGISSIMCFEAYVDDYSTSMDLSALLDSDKNQLDGTVAAGKKMNGVIGYEAPSDWSEIEIRFTPDFWSGKDITFVYSK